jgi:hypothetical protein
VGAAASTFDFGAALSDTTRVNSAPESLVEPFKVGFSDSIDLVFLIAAAVVAVGFFVFLFLPQLALSNKSGIQARQDEASEQAGEAVGHSAPTSVAPATAPGTGDGTRDEVGSPRD